MAINEQPATNVLAQVYQLYMVEYHFASMLMSHSHGIDDITVNPKNSIYKAAQTVFVQVNLFPSSTVKDLLSMLRDNCRILAPIKYQRETVSNVHTVKNPLFKKGDFVCNSWLPFTFAGSAHW